MQGSRIVLRTHPVWQSEMNPYTITHHWGDPREPTYENRVRVAFVEYREGSVRLQFRVGAIEYAAHTEIRWRLWAPKDSRKVLGRKLKGLSLIAERVHAYLRGLVAGGSGNSVGYDFSSVTLDTSKVPGYWAHVADTVRRSSEPVTRYLPDWRSAVALSVGFLLAGIGRLSPGVLGADAMLREVGLIGLWTTSVFFLALRISRDYSIHSTMFLTVAALTRMSGKKVSPQGWRLNTIQSMVRRCGFSYLLTMALSLLLLFYGA